MEKISFIIPAYNVENYIGRCLDSIICFKRLNWECVVVNDGSTDLTGDILNEYHCKDDRIRVIHKKNAGVSEARNTGINYAQGKYIFFIDADDYFFDNAEDVILKSIENICDGTVCLYNFKKVFEDGQEKLNELPKMEGNYIEKLKKLTVYEPKMNNCWGTLYERNVIIDNKIKFDFTMKVAEDTCFVLNYLKYMKDVKVFSEPIIAYWQREASAIRNVTYTTILDDEKAFYARKDLYSSLEQFLSSEEYGIICSSHLTNCIGYLANGCTEIKFSELKERLVKFGNSEYGIEILYNSNCYKFNKVKVLFYQLLRKKMYGLCCVLLHIYERKRTSNIII